MGAIARPANAGRASLGPRPFGRGNTSLLPLLPFPSGCFNGATPSQTSPGCFMGRSLRQRHPLPGFGASQIQERKTEGLAIQRMAGVLAWRLYGLYFALHHLSIPILPHCGQVTTSGLWALNIGIAALQPAQRTRVMGRTSFCSTSAGACSPSVALETSEGSACSAAGGWAGASGAAGGAGAPVSDSSFGTGFCRDASKEAALAHFRLVSNCQRSNPAYPLSTTVVLQALFFQGGPNSVPDLS